MLLSLSVLGLNAAVTMVHTGVPEREMAAIVRTADIVVAAAGRPHLLTPDMVQPGAAVVSAGTTFEGRKLIPTPTPMSPRWPDGSRRGSAGSAP